MYYKMIWTRAIQFLLTCHKNCSRHVILTCLYPKFNRSKKLKLHYNSTFKKEDTTYLIFMKRKKIIRKKLKANA